MLKFPYRIIFSDLDGTLLNPEHQLTLLTVRALQAVKDAGIPFVMVSARMPEAILPIAQKAGITVPIISYSGALALKEDGTVLKSTVIPADSAWKVLHQAALRWPHAVPNYYSGHVWYVQNQKHPFVQNESRITQVLPAQQNFFTLLRQGTLPHKLLYICSPADCAEMEEALSGEYPELAVVRSSDILLEIMDASVNKAAGVKVLLNAYGLQEKDAVAFGDSYNDIPMLKAAGTGIAMGNAPEAVKAAADLVIGCNDKDGLAQFLNQNGLPFHGI